MLRDDVNPDPEPRDPQLYRSAREQGSRALLQAWLGSNREAGCGPAQRQHLQPFRGMDVFHMVTVGTAWEETSNVASPLAKDSEWIPDVPEDLPQDSELIPDVPEDLLRTSSRSQIEWIPDVPEDLPQDSEWIPDVPEDLPQDIEWIPDVRCP
ncbi:unnamed protein product [Gadus morhua 'NCC']